jgi:predicted nucleotidyltransferase component of viral defense system
MFNPAYIKQVKLLLQTLPLLEKYKDFAMKGGTAINLFVKELPRLSVDIDLTYLPLKGRDEALSGISNSLEALAGEIEVGVQGYTVLRQRAAGVLVRLVVNVQDAQIKIETNFVFRGVVFPPQMQSLCKAAQTMFEQFADCHLLSVADLYGGKICAALDRQHPRDLFDVHLMFENPGLTDDIRTAFIVYLAGHPRPIAELLNPREKPLEEIVRTQFAGMTRDTVSLETLIETRQRLIKTLNEGMTANERLFLLSLKTGEPDWGRLPLAHLEQLPALQWKLRNIRKMDTHGHRIALDRLKRALGL